MLVIYVFSKDGLIKCLGNLAYEHLELLDDGWIHTATLDPCRYIESLLKLTDSGETPRFIAFIKPFQCCYHFLKMNFGI